MNVMLSRVKRTIVLGWFPPQLSPRQFAGGGVFNTFGHGLWQELPCRPIGLTDGHWKHPYSVPIEVPVSQLETLVEKMISPRTDE